MSYLSHIHRCNNCDLAGFQPWSIDGRRVGYIHRELAWRLRDYGSVFDVSHETVALRDDLVDPGERTRAVDEVLEGLRSDGLVQSSRNEPYAVVEYPGDVPLMCLDRSAVTVFGTLATGFHMNGTIGNGPDRYMWIARRSLDKTTFPGMLDNIVAGGQPADISIAQNVIKECHEEADIPEELSLQAHPVGLISYTMHDYGGLHRHVMYLYDLSLPIDFQPNPRDGEVESFRLLPINEVARIVRTDFDAFKFNCNLAIIDYLIRHGDIAPGHPEYFDLVTGLHGEIA